MESLHAKAGLSRPESAVTALTSTTSNFLGSRVFSATATSFK